MALEVNWVLSNGLGTKQRFSSFHLFLLLVFSIVPHESRDFSTIMHGFMEMGSVWCGFATIIISF